MPLRSPTLRSCADTRCASVQPHTAAPLHAVPRVGGTACWAPTRPHSVRPPRRTLQPLAAPPFACAAPYHAPAKPRPLAMPHHALTCPSAPPLAGAHSNALCAQQGRPEAVWSHRADSPHALSARCSRPNSAPSTAISPFMPMLQALCVNLLRSPGPWPPPAAPSPAPHARAAPAVLCGPHKIRGAPLRARSCAVRRHASSSPPCALGFTQPLHPERSRRLLLLW